MKWTLFRPNSGFILRLLLGVGLLKLCLAAALFLGPLGTPSLTSAKAGPEDSAGPEAGDKSKAGPALKQTSCNPEVLEILRAEARQWKQKKRELDAKEKDLGLLKSEIDERLKELKNLQARLEGPVKKAKASYEAKFQHLVGVYSSMEPARAAALLDKMDEAMVAKIFGSMKSKKVAKILALMEPEKAARISSTLSMGGPGK